MRKQAEFVGESESGESHPIGKTLQYRTGDAWKLWTTAKQHHIRFKNQHNPYIDDSQYPFCRERGLKGMNCFFQDFNKSEDVEEFETFQGTFPDEIENYNHDSSALSHLLTYADLLRMQFRLRPFMKEMYQTKLQTIMHHDFNENDERRLSVSIHIRRADSCNHKHDGFETKASVLDSPAQPTNLRKCYDTSVYLDALMRVHELVHQQALDVYVASDNANSLITEIQKNHPDVYKKMNWHFLDHGKDAFKYQGTIEYSSIKETFGESAVLDLWLLSHGQVFIGHLGSRFGKAGWLLATARFHTLAPFLSVDGHAFCCDIDEHCANVKPYITDMANCLTFTSDMAAKIIPFDNTDYWTEKGHSSRKQHYERQHGKQNNEKV